MVKIDDDIFSTSLNLNAEIHLINVGKCINGISFRFNSALLSAPTVISKKNLPSHTQLSVSAASLCCTYVRCSRHVMPILGILTWCCLVIGKWII